MNPFPNPNLNLTLAETQAALGITDPRTAQNWLFRQSDVLETRDRLTVLREKNARGDTSLPDPDETDNLPYDMPFR